MYNDSDDGRRSDRDVSTGQGGDRNTENSQLALEAKNATNRPRASPWPKNANILSIQSPNFNGSRYVPTIYPIAAVTTAKRRNSQGKPRVGGGLMGGADMAGGSGGGGGGLGGGDGEGARARLGMRRGDPIDLKSKAGSGRGAWERPMTLRRGAGPRGEVYDRAARVIIMTMKETRMAGKTVVGGP